MVDARTLLRDLRESLGARRSDGPPHILWSTTTSRSAQLLRQELEGHGYVVHEAADGHEGFRMARALGPDLVTLDVMMPDVNGFDVAAALRQDPATMRIPVMMISVVQDEPGASRSVSTATSPSRSTVSTCSSTWRRCWLRAAGSGTSSSRTVTPRWSRPSARRSRPRMAGDPVEPTPSSRWCEHSPDVVIARKPTRVTRPASSTRPRGPRPSTPSSSSTSEVFVAARRGKILIVDDEAHIRTPARADSRGPRRRGRRAADGVRRSGRAGLVEAERPDLVFLDVMMPSMNGYDVCRAVRTDLGLTDVTIVLLTAKGQEADRRRGVEVGADVFLTSRSTRTSSSTWRVPSRALDEGR